MTEDLFAQRKQEQVKQLKKMGWVFIGLSLLFIIGMYISPQTAPGTWLSPTNKQGVYVLSALFIFFGFYCLGAAGRKRYFL